LTSKRQYGRDDLGEGGAPGAQHTLSFKRNWEDNCAGLITLGAVGYRVSPGDKQVPWTW
jgi:hypothetical protein